MNNIHTTREKILQNVFLYGGLLVLAAIWFVPILGIFLTSIKSQADYYSGMGLFELPDKIYWQNYRDAFYEGRLGSYMRNGLMVSLIKVPLGIFIEALAAFALTRLPIRFKTPIFLYFLVGMMLPAQIALVPINIIFSKLGLLNTYYGLFYIYIAFGTGFGILILRGFFLTIPTEIDDAAMIDGCGRWQLFLRIILPISKPAIATLFIIDFLGTWNEFILASVIIYDDKMKTVPTGLMNFVGEYSTNNGLLSAGVLITIIPVLLVFLFFQRYFVEGLSGSIKG
ncbi:MAG: carbohydrate ABC transporter permease [Spirochaetaceae bacterium]|nr:MAG: carbohydrate ABC transporter permease [Spirochaetaceae bacterium]